MPFIILYSVEAEISFTLDSRVGPVLKFTSYVLYCWLFVKFRGF